MNTLTKTLTNEQAVGKNELHLCWLTDTLAVHHNVVTPWKHMAALAKKSGITLAIASGYRGFDRQLHIWNRKFSGEVAVKDHNNTCVNMAQLSDTEKVMAILTYSALPGASRHHWGTDIDVYAPNLLLKDQQLQLEPWEYQSQGYFFKLSEWLQQHAINFGFSFPYLYDQGGVAIEPWHLSFSDTAQQFQQTLTLPLLAQVIEASNIGGKAAILANLDVIYRQYVTNICEATTVQKMNKDKNG